MPLRHAAEIPLQDVDEAQSERLLLADLVRRQPLLVALNLGVGLKLGLFSLIVLPSALVVFWLVILVVGQVMRLGLWLWIRRRLSRGHAEWSPGFLLTTGSAIAGLTWGLAGFLLLTPGQILHETLIAFVIAGMVAGSVISLSQHPSAFYTFCASALVPYALRLAAEPDLMHRVMAGLALAFGLGMALISRQQFLDLRFAGAVRHRNALLLDELARAQRDLEQRVQERTAELQRTNSTLAREVDERQRSEARIRHLLHHDPLTNLPNRTLLHDRLEQSLARARRHGSRLAVMMLDVDRFKEVNDTHGHLAGDSLLRGVAERLNRTCRATDTAARVGGDEFAVVQADVTDVDDVIRLADRLRQSLSQPLRLDNGETTPRASIGIAVFPDHAEDAADLLRHADTALYQVKGSGGGGFALYDPALDHAVREQRQLERELELAVESPEIMVVYQPRFDVKARRIVAAEALVRWRHPRRGLLLPGTFISLAESTGLIRPLGRRVLRDACHQAAAWHRQGLDLRVSVNLSPVQLREPDLPRMIKQTLDATGVPPAKLELEVTESVYMEPAGTAISEALGSIRAMGIAIAIDDFGTGYSSLAYLKHLPFDVLKIDKRFVHALGEDPRDAAIVAAVVALARSLGKRVVAEGVESEAQLATLIAVGCHEAQGYLLARPSAAEAVTDWASHHGSASMPEPAGTGAPFKNAVIAAINSNSRRA